MTNDNLIVKQQKEIEEYKILVEHNKDILRKLHFKFYGIGQPLNDNIDQFNKAQMKWCFEVINLIEQISRVIPPQDEEYDR